MDKVEMLRDERDEALRQAGDLEDLLRRFNIQLANSGSLTESLEEEFKRWTENVEILNALVEKLVGDVFLSVSGISY
jgi:dynein heavy chain, axonemal